MTTWNSNDKSVTKNVKVKFTLEQDMNVQKKSTAIFFFFHKYYQQMHIVKT
jgi:hypothetical protein